MRVQLADDVEEELIPSFSTKKVKAYKFTDKKLALKINRAKEPPGDPWSNPESFDSPFPLPLPSLQYHQFIIIVIIFIIIIIIIYCHTRLQVKCKNQHENIDSTYELPRRDTNNNPGKNLTTN